MQIKIEEGFVGQQMIVLPPDNKKKITTNKLSRNLYPTAIGFYPHASYHDRERPKGSPQYILLYCTDGQGWIEIKGETKSFTPNTYFIIPKNVRHHYGSSQNDPWSIYWIHFTGEHADLFYDRCVENDGGNVIQIAYDENRIQTFMQLFSLLGNDLTPQSVEIIYLKLQQVLASIIYNNLNSDETENDVVDRSIIYMKGNLLKTFRIRELADQVNYSVSRYSELFRKKTGRSPVQYFIRLKIHKSCQLLYFTKATVKDICQQIGFEDPFYFSRMFKKSMGISPLKYRKQHKS